MLIRIVIVDDDERFLLSVRESLRAAGDIACLALVRRAAEALRVVPALRPDVALVALRLAGGSGLDFARSVKAVFGTARIIMISDCSDEHVLLEALMAGASGYIIKPASGAELERAVRAVHSGGASLCPASARALIRVFQTLPQGAQPLSTRERQVMACLLCGHSNKEIAVDLKIGSGTVHTYAQRIFHKTGTHCRTEAIRRFLGLG